MNFSDPPRDDGSLLAASLRPDYFTGVGEVVRDMQCAEKQAQAVELLSGATSRRRYLVRANVHTGFSASGCYAARNGTTRYISQQCRHRQVVVSQRRAAPGRP